MSGGSVRYWMFCPKGQGNENLPPTSDTLQQNMKRGLCVEESAGGNTESTVGHQMDLAGK